jgi:hypothetical protein
LTCACIPSQAQVNIITTIAGKDTFGYSGDGGPATDAQLKAPCNICYAHNQYLYIVDALNNRVRSIDMSTGIITTIIGTGTPGFDGDNGQATDAKIRVPQGVATDAAGNIYFSDAANQRIRKVDITTGIITTIAGTGTSGSAGNGGPATDAELYNPIGVCVDKSNNVYVADWSNVRVRKINQATGIITTIAGTGVIGYTGDNGPASNATINSATDIALDTFGNILFGDQYNHAIRKIDAVTGVISTIAGNGTAGYSGNGGQATNARLNEPSGIFVDKQNNIYVAEYNNGTIRRIDAVTNIITTVAGIGVTGFSGDNGPATDAKLFCTDAVIDKYGNLIIADYENNRIRKVNNAVAVNGVNKEVESKLYPNPTKGIFTIQAPIGISFVNIYNIAGMRVYERTCTTTETEIDITSLPSGVYMVYVQCGDKQYLSKIVKE